MLLEVKNLKSTAEGREILHDISFSVKKGETIVFLGMNGAGKSTLGASLMGDPRYQVSGQIIFKSQNILSLPPDQRAKMGLFMTMQSPIEIPGISTTEFLRTAIEESTGRPVKLDQIRSKIMKFSQKLDLDLFTSERDLNVGFSGGEKKKNEVLQMLVLSPELTIFDEIDSGLDVDAAKLVSRAIADLQQETGMSAIIITHNMRVLKYLSIDRVIIIENGRIKLESDQSILSKIKKEGFSAVL